MKGLNIESVQSEDQYPIAWQVSPADLQPSIINVNANLYPKDESACLAKQRLTLLSRFSTAVFYIAVYFACFVTASWCFLTQMSNWWHFRRITQILLSLFCYGYIKNGSLTKILRDYFTGTGVIMWLS